MRLQVAGTVWTLLFAGGLSAQSNSAFRYDPKSKTVQIENVAYEVQGRLILRKTTQSKRALDEIGQEATTRLEAWSLGTDLKQKPLYSISLSATGARTEDSALWIVSRGLEEVEWWSVHKLGNGQHLFDTYVPPVKFSISREILTQRYVGLEVPPDDSADGRLKDPHVVAVLIYASADRVIREALLTCDDPKQAQLLRSYADVTREMSVDGDRAIRISFSQNYPSASNTIVASVPVARDDLDLAHAQLPPHLHIAAWKRK